MADTPSATIERFALRPDEAAASIGISRAKLYQLMKDGAIPFFKIGGNRRIHPDALREYTGRLHAESIRASKAR